MGAVEYLSALLIAGLLIPTSGAVLFLSRPEIGSSFKTAGASWLESTVEHELAFGLSLAEYSDGSPEKQGY